MGHHTCANRGDSAISRGLYIALQQYFPNATFSFISQFPVSSSYLSGRPYQANRLRNHYQPTSKGLLGKFISYANARFFSRYLGVLVRYPKLRNWMKLPAIHQDEIKFIQQFDLVVQVGGSYFVDLYGTSQFDYALCTILAQRPLYLVGHSVGPFRNKHFNALASLVFTKAKALVLRETLSRQLMLDSNIQCNTLIEGADTAWLIHAPDYPLSDRCKLTSTKPVIAITLRKLYPFDQTLGINQSEFNFAIVSLLDNLIDAGYEILMLSTCTGIDGYVNDDRMIALTIQQQLKIPSAASVEMRELNDIELGTIFSQCVLTIGTRLHSAIISMNFGTPAFAINYEHKSAGILNQMALPELAIEMNELLDGKAERRIFKALDQHALLKHQCELAVTREKLKATAALDLIFRQDLWPV